MIISRDINPDRDFYYLGAKIIEILSSSNEEDNILIDVYQKMKQIEDISLNLFTLTLDWLYIIGAISHINEGKIIKCF